MINDNLQNRKSVLIKMMIFVFVVFVCQLINLQIINKSYKESADSNAFLKKIKYPARGLIYDRNGKLLVYNKPAYDVMVVMKEVQEFDTLDFCRTMKIDKAKFHKLMKATKNRLGYSDYTPQQFIAGIDSVEVYAVLREKLSNFPGFHLQDRTLRGYRFPCAAHAFGSVGEVSKSDIEKDPYYIQGEYIGKNGVEKFYEKELRGVKGVEILMRDSRGRVKGSYENGALDIMPESGNNITLSLDIELQEYGEKLMQGKIGSIVAIEPATGEILALVSSPSFDPSVLVGQSRTENFNQLNSSALKPLLDRPLQARYPPGSTFKVVNSLIFQQEGIINEHTRYPCHGGFVAGGLRVGCHSHVSPLDLPHSLQHSCNAYYCYALRAMIDNNKYGSVQNALETWKDHIVSFGFGYKLGVDFPTENRGYIPNAEVYDKVYGKRGWRGLTIISIAIGQGEVISTPIQTANLAAIIANRGYWYTPHIVKKIQGGHIDSLYTRKRVTSVERRYFEPAVEGMELAVLGGTARIASLAADNIVVCGKTGTAQNPHGKDHSIFMAFAPKDNPKIAIAVFVENAGFGATWAGPIASLMMEKYLKKEIAPTRKYLEERMFNTSLMPLAAKH
ncbi:MAG: penicillin-binding protein 2 [Prevotellaceae bacterium]|jgi:penicillin-binding protein 2|nr:penicillin-binding protein 2 [Prevotellaceae bacterium]